MNICIVTSSYPRTPTDSINAGVFVRDFAQTLHKTGQHVFVYTHRKKGPVDHREPFEVKYFDWLGDETNLTSLNPSKPFDLMKAMTLVRNGTKGLLQFIEERKIDACLAMWAIPSGWFTYKARKELGVPYSVWALGSDIWKIRKYPFGKKILGQVLGGASHLFADGIRLSKDVEEISGRSCQFLPSSRILPIEHHGNVNVDTSKVNFLFIGRWHPHKGPDLLLDAFHLLVKETKDVHLYMFGGGELESLIRTRIRAYHLNSHVTLGGYASPETVVEYLKACDCLVIPSRIESIPVIFSDAMQMGTPVIVTDVGDMGALTRKYEVGLVSRPYALDLKETMRIFPRDQGISAYRLNAEKLYNNVFCVHSTVNAFVDILQNGQKL